LGVVVEFADVEDWRGELVLKVGENEIPLKATADAAIRLARAVDESIFKALGD
jgi:hypothetical protein